MALLWVKLVNYPKTTMPDNDPPSHFRGKEAIGHVVEAQAQGLVSSAEVHGTEPPGDFSAATDAARETAIFLLLLWTVLSQLPGGITLEQIFILLSGLSFGWLFWKTGRSAWLGWFRLERLHRIVEQERYEIEHHRQQERDELRVLYQTKGFEGKLLEEVLDVLMADNDRLLKVMVEEELGLTLGAYQHPLKQGLGAAAGVILSTFILLMMTKIWQHAGMAIGSALIMTVSSGLTAYYSKNKIIPAILWNLGLTALAFSASYFSFQLYLSIMGD